jgi:transposase
MALTVHHKASGARGGAENNAVGRSRGGLTSKIVALVDAVGNLVRFILLPGQRHDSVGGAPLIEGVSFDAWLGDKAFDADGLRAELNDRGAAAVIPPRSNRKMIIDYHTEMSRWRHLVENYFAKIKEFRSIATRYDKTIESFRANINLAAAVIAAR